MLLCLVIKKQGHILEPQWQSVPIGVPFLSPSVSMICTYDVVGTMYQIGVVCSLLLHTTQAMVPERE